MMLALFFEARFQVPFTEGVAEADVALSADGFAAAWAAGERLSLDEATDLALAELAAIEAETTSAATRAST